MNQEETLLNLDKYYSQECEGKEVAEDPQKSELSNEIRSNSPCIEKLLTLKEKAL